MLYLGDICWDFIAGRLYGIGVIRCIISWRTVSLVAESSLLLTVNSFLDSYLNMGDVETGGGGGLLGTVFFSSAKDFESYTNLIFRGWRGNRRKNGVIPETLPH